MLEQIRPPVLTIELLPRTQDQDDEHSHSERRRLTLESIVSIFARCVLQFAHPNTLVEAR